MLGLQTHRDEQVAIQFGLLIKLQNGGNLEENFDQLIAETFPDIQVVSDRWKRLRQHSSNATSDGRKYLHVLQKHRFCLPFATRQQMSECAKFCRQRKELLIEGIRTEIVRIL